MLQIRKMVPKVKLIFQSPINSFSNSIFIRVMLCGHADVNMVLFQSLDVIRTAVL